jgi:putative tricarboxylic transport membrane protein
MQSKLNMKFRRQSRLAIAVVASLACSLGSAVAYAWEPTKSVEFVVPAGTGGGADQMARFIQGVVSKHNLMKQPLVVVNKRPAQNYYFLVQSFHHANGYRRAV